MLSSQFSTVADRIDQEEKSQFFPVAGQRITAGKRAFFPGANSPGKKVTRTPSRPSDSFSIRLRG